MTIEPQLKKNGMPQGDDAKVTPEMKSFLVLLSDLHVGADRDVVVNEANTADVLQAVVAQVLTGPKPDQVLVNGDVAYEKGLAGDYAHVAQLLSPWVAARLPVAMTLGNHDDRVHFKAAGQNGMGLFDPMDVGMAENDLVASRHLGRVSVGGVDWYLLDSLRETDETPGELGEAQRAWLAKELDARPEQPAFVMAHHQPENPNDTDDDGFGLADSVALMALLEPRRQVKAVFHGHQHIYGVRTTSELHVVGLPATGFMFEKGNPLGYCEVRVEAGVLEVTRRRVVTGDVGEGKGEGDTLRLVLRV